MLNDPTSYAAHTLQCYQEEGFKIISFAQRAESMGPCTGLKKELLATPAPSTRMQKI